MKTTIVGCDYCEKDGEYVCMDSNDVAGRLCEDHAAEHKAQTGHKMDWVDSEVLA